MIFKKRYSLYESPKPNYFLEIIGMIAIVVFSLWLVGLVAYDKPIVRTQAEINKQIQLNNNERVR
jgi:hypothetical protein